MFTSEVQFGHAGACANAEEETADAKNKALLQAGALVPDSFDTLGIIIGYVSGGWSLHVGGAQGMSTSSLLDDGCHMFDMSSSSLLDDGCHMFDMSEIPSHRGIF